MFSTGFSKKHNWSSRPLLPLFSCSFISFLSDIYGVKSTSLFLFIPNSLTTASYEISSDKFPKLCTHPSASFHHCIQISPSWAPVQLWLQQSCFAAWFSSCRSRYSGLVLMDFLPLLKPLNTGSVPDPKLLAISVGNLMHCLGFPRCHLPVAAAHGTISDYSPLLECNRSISPYRLPHSNPWPIGTTSCIQHKNIPW